MVDLEQIEAQAKAAARSAFRSDAVNLSAEELLALCRELRAAREYIIAQFMGAGATREQAEAEYDAACSENGEIGDG